MNAYSEDLRIRVIKYVETGHSRKEAAEKYEVSERTICSWIKLKKETGSLKVEAVPRSPHKLHDEDLLSYVKMNPDSYLREIAEHFNCCVAAVHKALKRLGIVYKKTLFVSGEKRRETKTLCRFCKADTKKSSSLC
jgi:transposase